MSAVIQEVSLDDLIIPSGFKSWESTNYPGFTERESKGQSRALTCTELDSTTGNTTQGSWAWLGVRPAGPYCVL